MEESGKVAIARFVFRNKEHLAAMRPGDGVLTLTTMRFADEVVPPSELEDVLPDGQAESRQERGRDGRAADRLADAPSFDPGAYRDEYREQLLALIERKAEGKEVVAAPEVEEPQPTKAPDLMAALEESIAAVKGEAKPSKPKAKKGEIAGEEKEGGAEEKLRRRVQSQSPRNSPWPRAARSRSTGVS